MRHHVKHDYHDHLQSESNCSYISSNGSQGGACGENKAFPLKLHELLDNAEALGINGIISWQIHGRAFAVHNQKEFSTRVISVYFNQGKVTSFFRQLSLYGFLRITQGRDKGAYYHERFLRGKRSLAKAILRQKVKGTKVKGIPSPDTEPNFYSMPFVPELRECISDLEGTGNNIPLSLLEQSFRLVVSRERNEEIYSTRTTLPNEIKFLDDLQGDLDALSWDSDLFNALGIDFSGAGEEVNLMDTFIQVPDDFPLQSDLSDDLSYDDPSNSDVLHYSMHEWNVLVALVNADL